jgi:hypothetical protein
MPRDAIDVVYGIAVFVVIGLVPLVSLFTAYLVTKNDSVAIGYMAAGALMMVAYSICSPVRGLEINEEGIRFQRWFGYPKFLAWARIISIRPATRSELLLQGWLRFPLREETSCMTSLGHYRIEWTEDFRFFPPLDCKQFEAAVEHYGKLKIEDSSR